MKKLASLLFALILLTSMTSATDYFVKNGGDDSKSGLDDTNAWACCPGMTGWTGSVTLSAGDTVQFKRDDVWRDWVEVSAAGSDGSPITFTDYGSGDLPKIMGSDEVATWSDEGNDVWSASYDDSEDLLKMVWFYETGGSISWGEAVADAAAVEAGDEYDFFYDSGATTLYVHAASDPDSRYTKIEAAIRYVLFQAKQSYIIVENIEFLHARVRGLYFWGHAGATNWDNKIVQDCEFHHIGWFYGGTYQGFGITLHGGDTKALRNKVYQIGRTGILTHGYEEAQRTRLIEGNEIFNFYYDGIDVKAPDAGENYDLTIRCNLIYMDDDEVYTSVYSGTGIYVQETNDNLRIYENIILNVLGIGIAISGDVVEAWVCNNVICEAGRDGNWAGISGFGLSGTGVIKNNIIMNSHYYPMQITSTNTTCDYNCYYQGGGFPAVISYIDGNVNETLVEHRTETGYDENGIDDDPLFVNAGGSYELDTDFLIPTGSPCKDAGFNVGLSLDYFGNMVWSGTAPDVGVHEFQQGDIPTVLIRNILLIRDEVIIR